MSSGGFETLASGYGLAEAPCWVPAGHDLAAGGDGSVLFSDVLGGGVYRSSPDGRVDTVVPKRRGVGGLALHVEGGVICSGRDVQHVHAGGGRSLLAQEGVAGFNDMATDAEGRLYVGALRFHPFGGEPPVPGEVWRLERGREPLVAFGGVDWANGIGFSPDGHTVYCCDFASGRVLSAQLDANGCGFAIPFAESPSGDADGLAVDERGGVWVALGSGGGLGRFRPDGALDTTLDVPASFVSSVCFGGDDLRDLYVTTAASEEDPAAGALMRARVDVPGIPVVQASV